MSVLKRQRDTTFRVLPRAAAVTLAVGGLASSAVVLDSAGAVTPRAKSLVVSTTANPTYGTILVSGNTLYTLKSSKSQCGGKCLKVWPELLLPKGVRKAKAGTGVNAAKLGTVKRKGGALQVTYAGKALYWFYQDSAPGQVNGVGKDKWGTWSVVVTAKSVRALQPAAGTTTTAPASTTTTKGTGGTTPTSGRTGTGGTVGGTMPPAGTTPAAPAA
ncbi:MAG TPA: hypothetical protein VK283_14620, partial [Acidimicrobiales bacterium]|nr:hypothetical protein [Acidimicrobiales bacterium]